MICDDVILYSEPRVCWGYQLLVVDPSLDMWCMLGIFFPKSVVSSMVALILNDWMADT